MAYQSLIFAVLDRVPLWRSGLSPGYLLANTVVVMALSGIVYSLAGRWMIAQTLTHGGIAVLILAHLGKMLTLNRPLYLADLASAGQVVSLLPALARSMVGLLVALAVVVLAVILGLVLASRHPGYRARILERLAVGALAAIVLAPVLLWSHLIPAGSGLDTTLRDQLWGGRTFFVQKGFVLASLLQLSIAPPSPETYDQAAVEAALKRAGLPAPGVATPSGDLPDIVLYLSEAMWDPTALAVSFNQDPVPNLRRLLSGPVAGEMRVPVFGGLTPQTELEVLTGLSADYFPMGTVVYQRYLHQPLPSMAAYLRQLGYHTTAVHTNFGWFWDRRRALPLLGFERFITIDDFPNPPMEGAFISDDALVDRVVSECALASPCLVFGISMMGHGPYDRALPKEQPIRVTGGLGGPGQVTLEAYANTLFHADRSLGRLIDQLATWPRPIVVAGFGDHLPLLGADFAVYRETGFRSRPTTPDEQERTHTTPAFIWSNRPLPPERLHCRATAFGAHVLQAAGLPPPLALAFAAHVDRTAPTPAAIPEQLLEDWWLLHHDLVFGEQFTARFDPVLASSWREARPSGPGKALGDPSAAVVEVLDYSPREIKVGETHLPQPDGSSAMWVRCRNASDRATILLDGESLQTTVGAGGVLTAIMPPAVLLAPGRHRVQVADMRTRTTSTEVEMVVLSPSDGSTDTSPAPKPTPLPHLLAWGPTSVEAGVPFNRQPDGSSAFWFSLDSTPASISGTLDGKPLAVTTGTAGLVSAAVRRPPERPGRYRVLLSDGTSGQPLVETWLEVREPAPAQPTSPP